MSGEPELVAFFETPFSTEYRDQKPYSSFWYVLKLSLRIALFFIFVQND